MRAVFGVVSLLVALAVVGLLASRQLKATRIVAEPGVVTSAAASAPAGTAREQAAQVQRQVVDELAKAAAVNAARASEAAP